MAAKFSSPTKRVDRPKASLRCTDCKIACPAGQKKKTTVTASCGASNSAGKNQPGKTTRRSIRALLEGALRPRLLSGVPLELPQQGIAALDGVIQGTLRVLLAGEGRFEVLGDDVADLHQIAETQPAGILGRRFCRHLDDRDLATRVLLVEPGRLRRRIGRLGDWQVTGHLVQFLLQRGLRQKCEEFGDTLVFFGFLP